MQLRRFYTYHVLLLALLFMTACNGGHSDVGSLSDADSTQKDTLNIDSLEQLYANNVMPLAADELFDDFFFNFAASGKLQLQRICFPLKIVKNGKEQYLESSQWTTNHFYLKQGYCTGIFSKEKDGEIVNDTTVRQAAVQHIDLKKKMVRNYHFIKLKRAWMLNNITETKIDNVRNAEFLNFYARFATDAAFQKQSLHAPVETTVPDPDSDFELISGNFYPEQWESFKPTVMPTEDMYNVVYDTDGLNTEKTILPTRNIFFVIRGIANGLSTTMKFSKEGKQWKLISIAN